MWGVRLESYAGGFPFVGIWRWASWIWCFQIHPIYDKLKTTTFCQYVQVLKQY